MNAIVEELLAGEKRQTGTADMMLQLAEWAAASYARYDRAAVDRIAKAAAEAAFALGRTAGRGGGEGDRLRRRGAQEDQERDLLARHL